MTDRFCLYFVERSNTNWIPHRKKFGKSPFCSYYQFPYERASTCRSAPEAKWILTPIEDLRHAQTSRPVYLSPYWRSISSPQGSLLWHCLNFRSQILPPRELVLLMKSIATRTYSRALLKPAAPLCLSAFLAISRINLLGGRAEHITRTGRGGNIRGYAG